MMWGGGGGGLCQGFKCLHWGGLGAGRKLELMTIIWCLKKMVSCACKVCSLCSCRGCPISCMYMTLIMEVCQWPLTTHWVAFIWTASSLSVFFAMYRSQTGLANSSISLTRVLYACSFMAMEPTGKFLLKNPVVPLALLLVLVVAGACHSQVLGLFGIACSTLPSSKQE